MSESNQHKKLVKRIISYVHALVGNDLSCFIQTDMDDEYMLSPQVIGGFRPDVYYEYKDILIIGEAKTSDDVSKVHSCSQYKAYLKKCQMYHGDAEFVLAVPPFEYAEANNIVRKIQKEIPGSYRIKILIEMV